MSSARQYGKEAVAAYYKKRARNEDLGRVTTTTSRLMLKACNPCRNCAATGRRLLFLKCKECEGRGYELK